MTVRKARRKRRGLTPGHTFSLILLGAVVGAVATAYVAYTYSVDATVHVTCDALTFDTIYIPPTGLYYAANETEQETWGVETRVSDVTLYFTSRPNVTITWLDVTIEEYQTMTMRVDVPTVFDDAEIFVVTFRPGTPTYDVGLTGSFKLPRGLILTAVSVTITSTDDAILLLNENMSVGIIAVLDTEVVMGYDSVYLNLTSIDWNDDDLVAFGEDVLPYVWLDSGNVYGHYADYDWMRDACADFDLPTVNATVTTQRNYDDAFNTGFIWGGSA